MAHLLTAELVDEKRLKEMIASDEAFKGAKLERTGIGCLGIECDTPRTAILLKLYWAHGKLEDAGPWPPAPNNDES